jgi:hypothetical protein
MRASLPFFAALALLTASARAQHADTALMPPLVATSPHPASPGSFGFAAAGVEDADGGGGAEGHL